MTPVSARIPDGSIALAHVWGRQDPNRTAHPRKGSAAIANALTDDVDIDPYRGMPVYQGRLVRISRTTG